MTSLMKKSVTIQKLGSNIYIFEGKNSLEKTSLRFLISQMMSLMR